MKRPPRPLSRVALSIRFSLAAFCVCLAMAAWCPAAEQALPPLAGGLDPALPPLLKPKPRSQPKSKPKPTPKPISVKSLFQNPLTEDSVTPAPPRSNDPYFRIGYLRPTDESPLGRDWYQGMRRELLANPAFQKAMGETGLSDVRLRPCDGPEDMLQRMGQAQLDIAFCPAMVYVKERIAHPERYAEDAALAPKDRYQVMFISQGRDARSDSRGSRHVRRSGVIFVRRNVETGNLANLLNKPSQVLAVSGSYDAVGSFYALEILREKYNGCAPRVLYYGSPQNVVKAVVSGLCDVGACEESALNEVLSALPSAEPGVDFAKDENPYVRVVERTKAAPTDPVVMRAAYDPGLNGSLLGAAARDVIRRLYAKNTEAPRLLAPEKDDPAYEAMVEDMKDWDDRAYEAMVEDMKD